MLLGKLCMLSVLGLCSIVDVVKCSNVFDRGCSTCNQIVFNIEQAMPDKFLEDGRELKTKIVKSDTECFVECSEDCRCMSFSVCGNWCHLNAGSQKLVRNSLRHKPGCRYYDFPAFKATCDPLRKPPGVCCSPSVPLCFNGGTCTVDVTDTTRRFKCQCPTGFYGNQCQIREPRTCLDHWTGQRKPLSGKYTIEDLSGIAFEVFCDFDSEAGVAWTLFESFDIARETNLYQQPFSRNFPLNENNLNWRLFRLPKSVMSDISSRSTFWRATCSYSVYGVDFRDYIRVRVSIMNPLNFIVYTSQQNSQPCFSVDYLDVKGTNCEGCTTSFVQYSNSALRLQLRQGRLKQNCTFDSASVEYGCSGEKAGSYANLLGFYSANCLDPKMRCSENANSTTEFWFGAKINN